MLTDSGVAGWMWTTPAPAAFRLCKNALKLVRNCSTCASLRRKLRLATQAAALAGRYTAEAVLDVGVSIDRCRCIADLALEAKRWEARLEQR